MFRQPLDRHHLLADAIGERYDARFLEDRFGIHRRGHWDCLIEVPYIDVEHVEIGDAGLVKTGGGAAGAELATWRLVLFINPPIEQVMTAVTITGSGRPAGTAAGIAVITAATCGGWSGCPRWWCSPPCSRCCSSCCSPTP